MPEELQKEIVKWLNKLRNIPHSSTYCNETDINDLGVLLSPEGNNCDVINENRLGNSLL